MDPVKRNRFALKSVNAKLMLSMVLVAIVMPLILTIVENRSLDSAMTGQVSQTTLQTTKQAQKSLEYYLEGVQNQVKQIGINVNFTEFYEHEDRAKYGWELLNDIVQTNSDYSSVYFGSTNKDMILAPVQELPEGYDPTSRDWYQGAVSNNGELFISEPYQDAVTKEMVVTLSQSVFDRNNEIVGVAAIDIDLTRFSQSISDFKVGEEGFISIITADGTYITNPDKDKVGQSMTKLALWDDMKKKKSGYTEYAVEGVDKFSAFTTDDNSGWRFISTLDYSEITKSSDQLEKFRWIMLAVVTVISAAIAYIIGNKISNNIVLFNNALKVAASGDFTTRVSIKTNDEFKELANNFNGMMSQLSDALLKVDDSSKAVRETSMNLDSMTQEANTALNEVAISISEIAKGANLQASNVLTSADHMKALATQLDDISTVTEEMNTVSQSSLDLSKQGLEVVNLLTEKASETKASTTEVAAIVKDVSKRMEEINAIIQVITQITEQTNLLSLNASIESARAGEHGRGFAVVANEVRSLAEQSKASAVEIKRIIDSIKDVVHTAVEAMEKTSEAVQHQDEAVKVTENIFNEMLSTINELANEVKTVEKSVNDSQANKDKVSDEMDNISAVAQQTAAATEEVSAAAEEISSTMQIYIHHSHELKELSEKLEKEIHRFKLK